MTVCNRMKNKKYNTMRSAPKIQSNRFGGLIVCMLTPSAVDLGFAPNQNYEIGICARNIRKSEQRLVSSEYVRVTRHCYQRSVFSSELTL